VIFGIEDTLFL